MLSGFFDFFSRLCLTKVQSAYIELPRKGMTMRQSGEKDALCLLEE
jgi:hypothetical protein